MLLDEAIERIKENLDETTNCGIKNTQLLNWLKELKEIRDVMYKYDDEEDTYNSYSENNDIHDEFEYDNDEEDYDYEWDGEESSDETLPEEVIPAMDEAFTLIQVRDKKYKSDYDVEIVSCGKEKNRYENDDSITIKEFIDESIVWDDCEYVSEESKNVPMSKVKMYYRAYDVFNKGKTNDFGEPKFAMNMDYTAFIDKDTNELYAVAWHED